MAARPLPTGTVTFLFSDIVGSTRLVSEFGPAVYADILERHNAALRAAFAAHGGVERGTQGDSFLVMFGEAPAALAAAADAQRALATIEWPRAAVVRVRIGIHTGVGRLGGDDYVGIDVHRAARIGAAAHGGQVLLSDATRGLVEPVSAAGLLIRDLGEFALRDIARPEHLYQLVIDGLPSEFPTPRSVSGVVGKLPDRITSFVGRERDLDILEGLLRANRLVTLTGPGGTGKTSLAVELARRAAGGFAHGAWFIPLDSVADPGLVPTTIADVLGLVEAPGQSMRARLSDFVLDRSALLILDNFEHLLPAATYVGELVQSAHSLKVIVTSRARLHLSSEQEFQVAPLDMADPADGPAAASSPAVRLFVDRARRVRPAFAPSGPEEQAIGEICRHLDGLPLGIELAASRIGLFPVSSIAERLGRRLDLPGAGARDTPARQRSLERTIGWSYELLDRPEQRLFARLSVFAGGCRLEEAERVCGPADELGIDVVEGLSTLVDHSLVQPEAGLDGPRFRLLETIRMFAAARLDEEGDTAEFERRHADGYLGLAEQAALHIPGRGQLPWLDRLTADHDNLRAAIRRSIAAGDAPVAQRLGAALWRFWQARGHLDEGRAALSEILAMPGSSAPTAERARALDAAGGLEWWRADIPAADAWYTAQLDLARQLGEPRAIADAMFNRAYTRMRLGTTDEVAELRREAIRIYTELGDARSAARAQWTEAQRLTVTGRLEDASAMMTEMIGRFEELDDAFYASLLTGALAAVALAMGDPERSLSLGLQAYRSQVEMGDFPAATMALRGTAVALLLLGRPAEATTAYRTYEWTCRRHGFRLPFPEDWARLRLRPEQAASIPQGDETERRAADAPMTLSDALAYLERAAARDVHVDDLGPGAWPILEIRDETLRPAPAPLDRFARGGEV